MSWTRDTHIKPLADKGVNCRTMAEIRGNIIERGKRHWVSGILNARGDRNAIAAWREELVMVLDVFNVRLFGSAWHSLTAPFQTELILNTYVAVERVSQKLDAFGYANQRGARCLSPSVSVIFS